MRNETISDGPRVCSVKFHRIYVPSRIVVETLKICLVGVSLFLLKSISKAKKNKKFIGPQSALKEMRRWTKITKNNDQIP